MTEGVETCPWALLGVTPADDRATIRKAWRDLVRRYHPDLAGTDREAANRKLAEINAAFDIVWDRDAARRKLEQDRKARAARQAEERRLAEKARRAEAARRSRSRRRAEAETAASDNPTARSTAPGSSGWSIADRLAARTARLAFERARRILDGAPAAHRPPVYL